jgi:hypothetical protein
MALLSAHQTLAPDPLSLAVLEDSHRDRVVKDYIFSHYEVGDEFFLCDIVKDTGLAEADVVMGLLNAWWWDCDARGPLLMVELVGESPDRFCFVRAPDDWLPDEDEN